MSLWVCSKWNDNPTDTEKWEVLGDFPLEEEWKVKPRSGPYEYRQFPKSDYRLCDPPQPPERWVDVTGECQTNGKVLSIGGGTIASIHGNDNRRDCSFLPYRLRKVEVWQTPHSNNVMTGEGKLSAFVVEKKSA